MLKLPVGSKGHISKSSHIKKVLVNIFVFVHTFKKKKKLKLSMQPRIFLLPLTWKDNN